MSPWRYVSILLLNIPKHNLYVPIGEKKMNISITKKLALGFLVGFALFGLGFQLSNGYVVSTNAVAVRAGYGTTYIVVNGTLVAVANPNAVGPYDPPWAWPMITGTTFFAIPFAVIFAKDLKEEENSSTPKAA